MSGYLGHLIKRSLAAVPGVRPRPVSMFETGQRSPAPPASSEMAFEETTTTAIRDDTHAERRRALGSGPDADMHGATPAASTPRADSGLDMHANTPQEVLGAGTQRAAARTETFVRRRHAPEPLAQPSAAADAGRVGAEAVSPAVAIPARPREPVCADLEKREQTEASPELRAGTPKQTIVHLVAPSDVLVSADAPARPLQLQGKPAAPPEPKHAEASPRPLPEVRQDFDPPAERVQGAHGESRDCVPAAALDVRVVTPPDPRRSDSRDEKSVAPTQAILSPRLPHAETSAQPMQPSAGQAAEPVVHVTIGRVEIRAVAAPATPKRSSAAAKPALSLSDYLERRGGGHG
jgi:hypothetical protein